MVAVLNAIGADRLLALEALEAGNGTYAGRAEAGWEKLERAYRNVALSCRHAEKIGVTIGELEMFQALVPSWALFDDAP